MTQPPADRRHLDLSLLIELLRGGADPADFVEVAVAHLEGCCDACDELRSQLREIAEAWDRNREAERQEAIEAAEALAVELEGRIEATRKSARGDLRHLLGLRSAARHRRVERARSRFSSPALVDLLLEEAWTMLRVDPREAADLAALAERVAFRVSVPVFTRQLVESLRLRAAAHRANALRVGGDLVEADELWDGIRSKEADLVALDRKLQAELASLEGSLRKDQRRFVEAQGLLDCAVGLYQAMGDDLLTAKTLIKRAGCTRFTGDLAAAIKDLDDSTGLLDPRDEPDLYLAAQSNLALCLVDVGDPQAARDVVERNRPLYDERRDPWTTLRLAWLNGRIARGLGESREAEEHLKVARNGYLGESNGFNASLVALDLAGLYLEQGRTAEVKRLAAQMAEAFSAREVHREAARSLELFRQAASSERLTLDFIARLRAYLEQARSDPQFRFALA